MIEDQIVTILTAVIQGVVILAVIWCFFKRFKRQILVVEGAIAEQKRSVDLIGQRVEETEKMGDLYRALLSRDSEDIETCRRFLNNLREDAIASLMEGDAGKDSELKRLSQVKIDELDLQLQMVSEVPALKEQLGDVLNRISARYQIIQSYSKVSATYNAVSQPMRNSAGTHSPFHSPGDRGRQVTIDNHDTDSSLFREKHEESE